MKYFNGGGFFEKSENGSTELGDVLFAISLVFAAFLAIILFVFLCL